MHHHSNNDKLKSDMVSREEKENTKKSCLVLVWVCMCIIRTFKWITYRQRHDETKSISKFHMHAHTYISVLKIYAFDSAFIYSRVEPKKDRKKYNNNSNNNNVEATKGMSTDTDQSEPDIAMGLLFALEKFAKVLVFISVSMLNVCACVWAMQSSLFYVFYDITQFYCKYF